MKVETETTVAVTLTLEELDEAVLDFVERKMQTSLIDRDVCDVTYRLDDSGVNALVEATLDVSVQHKGEPSGGHVFHNGVCSCGHKSTDDPERCPFSEKEQP